jgi:hypothetical protein
VDQLPFNTTGRKARTSGPFADDEWYTRQQLASWFKVAEGTIINWEQTLGLPMDKVGRVPRSHGRELNTWFVEQQSAA